VESTVTKRFTYRLSRVDDIMLCYATCGPQTVLFRLRSHTSPQSIPSP
jgi:hypothetical protein